MKFTFRNYINWLYEGVEDKLATISLKTKIPIEKLQQIFEGDPTPNKMYINWLVKLYQSGNLRFPEDAERTQEVLNVFNKVKHNTQFKAQYSNDIGQYKTIQDLWDAIRAFQGVDPSREGVKELPKGAQEIYNDGTYRIIKITDPNAAAIMAQNSEWCVRHEETAAQYLKTSILYLVQKGGYNYALLARNHKIDNDGFYTADYKDVKDDTPTDIFKELHPLWTKLNIIPNDAIIDSSFNFSDNVNFGYHFASAVAGSVIDEVPPKCTTSNVQFTEDYIFNKCKYIKKSIYQDMINCEELTFGYAIPKKENKNENKIISLDKVTKDQWYNSETTLKFDNNAYIHSDDGPAIIMAGGDFQLWYHHGFLHRKGGPAVIIAPRVKFFPADGGGQTTHQDADGNTIMHPAQEQWWENGVRIK